VRDPCGRGEERIEALTFLQLFMVSHERMSEIMHHFPELSEAWLKLRAWALLERLVHAVPTAAALEYRRREAQRRQQRSLEERKTSRAKLRRSITVSFEGGMQTTGEPLETRGLEEWWPFDASQHEPPPPAAAHASAACPSSCSSSSSSSSSSSLRTDLFSCAAPSSPSSSTHHEAPAPALWRLVQALEQAQRESQAMDERIRTMLLDEHEQAAWRQERLTSMMEEAKAAVSLFTQGAATDLSA